MYSLICCQIHLKHRMNPQQVLIVFWCKTIQSSWRLYYNRGSYCLFSYPCHASLSLRRNAKSKNTGLDYNIWQLCPRTIFILSAPSAVTGRSWAVCWQEVWCWRFISSRKGKCFRASTCQRCFGLSHTVLIKLRDLTNFREPICLFCLSHAWLYFLKNVLLSCFKAFM